MSTEPDKTVESIIVPVSLAKSWRPKHAWFFLGMTLVFANVINFVLFVWEQNSPAFYSFQRGPAGSAVFSILGLILLLVIALYFADPTSLADFVAACGLTRPRDQEILAAFAAGFVIQFVGILLFQGTLSHLRAAQTFTPMSLAALLAPFFEEPVMRGFVYKAFRNSYSVAVSICLVIVINLIYHWGVIHHSLYGCVVIATLNLTLCLLKERYSNLWVCIACHFAFNAAYVGIQQ